MYPARLSRYRFSKLGRISTQPSTNQSAIPRCFPSPIFSDATRFIDLSSCISIGGSSTSSWILPWVQLKSLELEYFVDGLNTYLALLNGCTVLEEFDLTISSEYKQNNSEALRKSLPPSITSPSLRTFQIQIQTIDCPELTSAVFDKVCFPALECHWGAESEPYDEATSTQAHSTATTSSMPWPMPTVAVNTASRLFPVRVQTLAWASSRGRVITARVRRVAAPINR
ncbi:hypothetical protein NMY22_g7041 [Coprinellus aureogranulatus]|nr:hypothetical protein NMY22_g7041 [Coprinellus aureogranulatus]